MKRTFVAGVVTGFFGSGEAGHARFVPSLDPLVPGVAAQRFGFALSDRGVDHNVREGQPLWGHHLAVPCWARGQRFLLGPALVFWS